MAERGVAVDPSCIWRWVQTYAPELNKRCRPHLKPTNKSYRTDADGDRHLALVDEVVEHYGSLEGGGFINERAAVLENNRAGGLIGFVLRGDVDPILTDRARVDLTGPLMLGDCLLRDARLSLRVGAQDIFLRFWSFLGVDQRGPHR